MNQTQHQECFGTMFPDVLHVENDRQQRGKVFSLLLERAGGMISLQPGSGRRHGAVGRLPEMPGV